MTPSIYTIYKELPASKIAQEQFDRAVETFELTVKSIKSDLKKAEEKFVAERDLARRNAEWEYYMTEPTINEYGKHYHIHRKAVNPQLGDSAFYKDISYGSFKLVNNVFISTGSGCMFQQIKTGDILTEDEVEKLNLLVVPERFKNSPIFKGNNYYSGS